VVTKTKGREGKILEKLYERPENKRKTKNKIHIFHTFAAHTLSYKKNTIQKTLDPSNLDQSLSKLRNQSHQSIKPPQPRPPG
jgi:hypothetical protein